MRGRQATLFAKKYAKVLEAGDMSNILWYNSHPETRKDKTGADLTKELESKPREQQLMQSSVGPLAQLNSLQERIKSAKGQKVNFVSLERVGEDEGHGLEMQIFALGLFEIVGPPSEKFPKEKEYALAILKARPAGREYQWWTEQGDLPLYSRDIRLPREAGWRQPR